MPAAAHTRTVWKSDCGLRRPSAVIHIITENCVHVHIVHNAHTIAGQGCEQRVCASQLVRVRACRSQRYSNCDRRTRSPDGRRLVCRPPDRHCRCVVPLERHRWRQRLAACVNIERMHKCTHSHTRSRPCGMCVNIIN